jgi:hypothetical protein
MPARLLTVICPVWLLGAAFAQSAAPITVSPEEQQLRYAETVLLRAENENNRELFDRALSPDFQAPTPDGRTYDKAKVLREASDRGKTRFPYRVEQSDLRIFRFENTAVVTYVKQYIGTEGEVAGKIRKQAFVDVFTKESGGWKLHFTKAEAPPPSNLNLAH